MLKRLLLPLSWLYGFLTDCRNWLYDKNILRSYEAPVPTVSVGNLTVGGTGKTPHVDFLIRQLPGSLATLSRGYGRRNSGFRMATVADTADTIGDEPLQLYRRHSETVAVVVGENRAGAIRQLLALRPKIAAIVLDDAFQHRAVRPRLNILLSDFNRPFYEDYPFPAGWLRERRHGAKRADAMIVTKCPDTLPDTERRAIEERLHPYLRPDTPVFFTKMAYGEPVSFGGGGRLSPETQRVLLVSGIARPEPLEAYVRAHFELANHLRFRDHHRYTETDLSQIRATIPPGGVVLTTEKDFVKLATLVSQSDRSKFFYLPIQVQFLEGEERFRQWLGEKMGSGV